MSMNIKKSRLLLNLYRLFFIVLCILLIIIILFLSAKKESFHGDSFFGQEDLKQYVDFFIESNYQHIEYYRKFGLTNNSYYFSSTTIYRIISRLPFTESFYYEPFVDKCIKGMYFIKKNNLYYIIDMMYDLERRNDESLNYPAEDNLNLYQKVYLYKQEMFGNNFGFHTMQKLDYISMETEDALYDAFYNIDYVVWNSLMNQVYFVFAYIVDFIEEEDALLCGKINESQLEVRHELKRTHLLMHVGHLMYLFLKIKVISLNLGGFILFFNIKKVHFNIKK